MNISKRAKIVVVTVPVIIVASLTVVFSFYYMEQIAAEAQITELYHKILKREPDYAGLNHYKEQIIRDEKSLEWVEENIRNSPEAVALRITELYNNILKRDPDPEGMNYYKEQVIQNEKSLQWVEEDLQNSPEAQSKVGMDTVDEPSDESKKIVDDLYMEILGRPADLEGLQHFASLFESEKMTVDDIRSALLESEEYKSMN